MSRAEHPLLRRLAAALVLAASVASSSPAGAEAPTEAQLASARERFREALALEQAGDFAAARAAFEEVADVKVTPQVLYHLAVCDEGLGSLVAAIARYREAIELAERVGESAAAVVEEARPRLAALEERVPRLRVRVDGELAPGDVVTVDGREIETWAEDMPVDPGPRAVAVVRDGTPIAETTVEAEPSRRVTARLALPVARVTPELAPPPRAQPLAADEGGGPPVAALVVGGVGVATLVAGGVTLALQQVAIEDVRVTCADPDAGTGCDPASRGREDDARTFGVTSGVLLGVGAACVATGVVLWIALDDEPPAPAASPARRPSGIPGRAVAVVPGPLGVTALGRF